MIFVDFGVVGIPEFPIFASLKGVNRLLSWRGIDRIEPVNENSTTEENGIGIIQNNT